MSSSEDIWRSHKGYPQEERIASDERGTLIRLSSIGHSVFTWEEPKPVEVRRISTSLFNK
jgi:hypothetical protein